MRYMGALSTQDQAAIAGFRTAAAQLSPEGQQALYDEAKATEGGAKAFLVDRAIVAGAGAVVGLVVGVAFARSRRRR